MIDCQDGRDVRWLKIVSVLSCNMSSKLRGDTHKDEIQHNCSSSNILFRKCL